jgi:hypothetical protein
MYFEVPKAACTQMKELLRAVEGAPPIKLFADGTWETRRDMFVHVRSNVPLPSLVDLDNRTQKEVLEAPDFLRMTLVRNPYTRLVSAWANKVLLCEPSCQYVYLQIKGRLPYLHEQSLVSFDEFVEYLESSCDLRNCDSHWRRQVDHAFFPALNFSFIGKVEQLDRVLRRFEGHLGLSKPLVADGRNASVSFGPNPYTREVADKVYSLYEADFEGLGYDRNAWAPSEKKDGKKSSKASISDESYRDEIIERNLIISSLYEQRDRLQAELEWVSRLRLLPVINGLIAFQSVSRRGARKIKRLARQLLRPRPATI